MNIRVDLNAPIKDGMEVVFRSPVDCSQITGLKVYYKETGNTASKEFYFADAHGNNVGDIPHLFAENVVVKVILDVTTGMAFVQNADTNAYIEKTFVKTVNGKAPDENGNVEVAGGPGGNVDLTGYATEQFVRDGFQPKGNYLAESALPTAIDTALAQAKASGEFDGKDGQDGQDGYTPQKGVDYFDGQPGRDGVDGKDGADGYTPAKGVDYFDGKDGKDGSNGKDGVSATHSWNGTVLTVTSASGTSSADLKGEKGDPGKDGNPGADGDDYVLTDADRQEIAEQAAGLVEIPSGGGFVASDTPPEDTSLLWVDTSDNSGNEGGGGDENIIPTETVLAEGTVTTGAGAWTPIDTGIPIATMNQYKRIRLAIKGASSKATYWCFQFTTQNTKDTNRITSASGMAVTLQKINNGYFRVESIESRGNADTVLKGMVTKADGWLSTKYGSISPVILDLTSYGESATLKIAPVYATEIDYSWCVCGYNC